jgi:hypothetical protein
MVKGSNLFVYAQFKNREKIGKKNAKRNIFKFPKKKYPKKNSSTTFLIKK